MEIITFLLFYAFAVTVGVGIARGVKTGLSHPLFPEHYSKRGIAGFIWMLFILCILHGAYPLVRADENDLKWWLLTVSVPWAVCILGLPMVLPRLWIAVKVGLNDGATQWLFTVVAAILSYGVFAISQWNADRLIQELIQTYPAQFPGAQRILTAIFAVYGWVSVLYLVAIVAMFLLPVVKTRATGKPLLTITATVPVIVALFYIPLTVVITFIKTAPTDEQGRRNGSISVIESLVLGASFMPNRVVEGVLRSKTGELIQQARLACRNLSPEAYVAFVHPDEVVPDKAVVAEPRREELAMGVPTYSYRLSVCENSNNPDNVR